MNTIITRGMGPQQQMVTRGYGEPTFLGNVIREILRLTSALARVMELRSS